jgi:hypothetical protein
MQLASQRIRMRIAHPEQAISLRCISFADTTIDHSLQCMQHDRTDLGRCGHENLGGERACGSRARAHAEAGGHE